MTDLKIAEHHLFEKNGVYFLFEVQTMNFYQINKKCVEIIEKIRRGELTEEFQNENNEVIEELKEAELLYDHKDDPADTDQPPRPAFDENGEIHIHNVILELANDCNLNCKYCYGDGGSYGRKKEMMSFETAKKAVDFLVDHSGKGEKLSIVFFGGEPLMNFKVMKAVVQYCREIERDKKKKFAYSMTTNGTILSDEIKKFLKDNKFVITLSIDGPKDVQDDYRCYVNGRGSFDSVLPNLRSIQEAASGKVMARATVCHPNLNLYDILAGLKELDFKSIALSLVDTKESSDLYIKEGDIPVIIEQIGRISDDYVEAVKSEKRHPYFLLNTIIADIYDKYKKTNSCGAGRGSIAVGTDGNLYPCQRFMGMEEYTLGHIHTDFDRDGIKEFREVSVSNTEGCEHCWCRFICGGGCLHSAAKANQTIHKAAEHFCEYYQQINEIALYTYWRLKEYDENIFLKRFEKAEKNRLENAAV